MELAPLILKKNEDRRLRAGHLWVFSNEVDVARTPLTAFQPGQAVVIQADNGRPIGIGYVNPNSLICARLVSRGTAHPLDRSLIVHRLNVALSLRERVYPEPYYRAVYGESDALPGLVVDRFGDVLVAQITTAGMEAMKGAVVDALQKVFKPAGILLRNDSSIRAMEGLDSYVEAVGDVPDAAEVVENGVRFAAPLAGGQKTGWFYDHRENRARLMRYVANAAARGKAPRVLDVFSYLGGWGIQAAVAGAAEVVCVDSSATALDAAERSAAMNGVAERVKLVEGDAFDALKALKADEDEGHFDIVVLDPPAFIKRKKDVAAGSEAYRRINQAAMQLLGKDGLLFSASCSYHLRRDSLLDILNRSARHLDRRLQLLESGGQGPDHPVHPAIPETDYLKCFAVRVVADQ